MVPAPSLSQTLDPTQLLVALTHSPNAVAVVAQTGALVWTNPIFADLIHAVTKDETLPLLWDLFPQGASTLRSAFDQEHTFTCTAYFAPYAQWLKISGSRLQQDQSTQFLLMATDITSEVKSAQDLQHREQRLQAVIDGTRIGTWEWNIETGATAFNSHWANMIGYDMTELQPMNIQLWSNFLHPKDLDVALALLYRHLAGESKFYDCRYRMRHKSGRWIWVHDRGQVCAWNDRGAPSVISGTHADITDLMEARQALEIQQQQLHNMLSNLPGTVFRYALGDEQQLQFVSKGVQQLTGLTVDQFISDSRGVRDLHELIHPEDCKLVQHVRQQSGGEGYQLEYRMQAADGSWRWVEEIGRRVQHENAAFLDGFIWDITEQKIAAMRLRSETSKLASLFHMAPIGIFSSLYEAGNWVEANPELRDMLGLSERELTHVKEADITPARFLAEDKRQRQLLEQNGRYGPYEKQLLTQNGELVDVVISGVRVREADDADLVWTLVQNVSEQKQLEKMKSELISVVSHELRTPLTSIIGSLGLIRRRMESDGSTARYRDLVEIAYSNGHRLNMLVNDLLDMEKLLAGKMAFKIEAISLDDLLAQAIAENHAYAEQYNIQLLLEPLPNICAIAVDRLRFQQIMSNLLSNAIKFSPAGEVVRVAASILGDNVRVEVRDAGPGIPAQFHSRIFQKFSQLDASSTRKKEGTGLGLAITRELVERMDGAIGFASEPGQGAVFFITLPVYSLAGCEKSDAKDV